MSILCAVFCLSQLDSILCCCCVYSTLAISDNTCFNCSIEFIVFIALASARLSRFVSLFPSALRVFCRRQSPQHVAFVFNYLLTANMLDAQLIIYHKMKTSKHIRFVHCKICKKRMNYRDYKMIEWNVVAINQRE